MTQPRDALGRPLRGADTARAVPVPATGPLGPEAALKRAQELLDAGLAFYAHEVLEEQWKAAPAAERELWRGLAQLAVAVTHAQRANAAGATALLQRAEATLRPWADPTGAPPPYAVAVATLTRWARAHVGQPLAAAHGMPPLRDGAAPDGGSGGV